MTRKRKNKSHQKRRRAMQIDKGKRTYIESSGPEGYNVEMIRDFFDHLLLELRTQLFEYVTLVRKHEASDNVGSLSVQPDYAPALAGEFTKYIEKYASALIHVISIKRENETAAEALEARMLILKQRIELRDKQIGHLEALRDLFDEALLCAKLPFGMTKDGEAAQPMLEYSVREVLDNVT